MTSPSKPRGRPISIEPVCPAAVYSTEEDLGKFRTKFCERKVAIGYCDHGGGWACNFSHNLLWLRRNPIKYKYSPKLCGHLSTRVASQCPQGMNCPFAHSAEEQFFHPLVYKSLPCLSRSSRHSVSSCPFSHGLSDHNVFLSGTGLSLSEMLVAVDAATASTLALLGLSAECLPGLSGCLEVEHHPGVAHSGSPANTADDSLLACLQVAPHSSKRLLVASTDRFLDTLDSERHSSLCGREESDSSDWLRVTHEVTLEVSSAREGYLAGKRCLVYRGRTTEPRFASAFDFFEGGDCFTRDVTVARLSHPVSFESASTIKPSRMQPEDAGGVLLIFDRVFEEARTLADWLSLSEICSGVGMRELMTGYETAEVLNEETGSIPSHFTESADAYCAGLAVDRGSISRVYVHQMLRAVGELHLSGAALGGFSLIQFVFDLGSLQTIRLSPLTLRDASRKSLPAGIGGCHQRLDIWSLGCCVSEVLLGRKFDGDVERTVAALASTCSGLAADLVARCFSFAVSSPQNLSSGLFEELEGHPFFWKWSSLVNFAVKGVAHWFQQPGNQYKPNAQRHLINWAEESFGCTKNQGVPAKRQVFRVTANCNWSVVHETGDHLVNLVGKAPARSLRASPLLLASSSDLVMTKCSTSQPSSRKENPVATNMLPVSCLGSHLRLCLVKKHSRHPAVSKYEAEIKVLLNGFHLTERTSVYSFLSFVLFAIANPHFCLSEAVRGEAAMLRRHRDVVTAIICAVPLGLLVAHQLAADGDLVNAALRGLLETPEAQARRRDSAKVNDV